MRERRKAKDAGEPCGEVCADCARPHLGAVRSAVESGRPVVLVLPGFPCKSPNPSKVLGELPDRAEELALDFLDGLCRRVGEVYAPGARVVICSDGRVFSDLIQVPDHHVTAYRDELRRMIAHRHADTLSLFTLDDLDGPRPLSHDDARRALEAVHGEPLENVRGEVREGGEPLRMYRAITRFLFEDGLTPDREGSRSALQRDARARAYEVILRSRAWGRLVAECFPSAVRLSIHPQSCGSAKFGIRLTAEDDDWLTPWHAVAVRISGRFVLRPRRDVEQLGARLVHQDGRPSHFVAPAELPAPAVEAALPAVRRLAG